MQTQYSSTASVEQDVARYARWPLEVLTVYITEETVTEAQKLTSYNKQTLSTIFKKTCQLRLFPTGHHFLQRDAMHPRY